MYAAKRRRILGLAGTGRVSDVGLISIVEAIRSDPALLDDPLTRRRIQTAYASISRAVACVHTFPASHGKSFDWVHCQPAALLKFFLAESTALNRFFHTKLVEHPSSPAKPWHLCLYGDEITPGNALSHQNLRKSWTWYFTFLEFGEENLRRDDLWFPIGVVRFMRD